MASFIADLKEFLNRDFWISAFAVAEWILRFLALIWVPRKRNDTAARAWLIAIFLFPVFGWILFALFGSANLPEWRLERRRKFRAEIQPSEPVQKLRDPSLAPKLGSFAEGTAAMAERLTSFPPVSGNQVEILNGYEQAIDAIVAAIDGARHHVHLLYYIFGEDRTGRRVAAALKRAAERGVKVRVLADALGSFGSRFRLFPALRKSGVEVRSALRVRDLRRSARIDLRNHRKILVVDGLVGFTGSQNIVDARYKKGLVFEELVAKVRGPVVAELQAVFAADWYTEADKLLESPDYYPVPAPHGDGGAMQVLPSDSGFDHPTLERLLVSMVHRARKSIVLTTPYFIPEDAFLAALGTAVLRDVKVTLILPSRNDSFLVGYAQRSYYEELLALGVRVMLYTPSFLHAKLFVIDDEVGAIGSSNMDVRSFALNAEVTMLLYDPSDVAKLQREQERYLARATQFQPFHLDDFGRWSWVLENVARLLSPLL